MMGHGELPVNLTRPEFSGCLKTDNPHYAEALELIRTGQSQLNGQALVPDDQRRLDFHAARELIDERNRQAIGRGGKVYDEGIAP